LCGVRETIGGIEKATMTKGGRDRGKGRNIKRLSISTTKEGGTGSILLGKGRRLLG